MEGRCVPARDTPPFGRNLQVWAHRQTLWRASAPEVPQPQICLRYGLPLLALHPAREPQNPAKSCSLLGGGLGGGSVRARRWDTLGTTGTSAPTPRAHGPPPRAPFSGLIPLTQQNALLAEGPSWAGPCWRHQAGHGGQRAGAGFLRCLAETPPRPAADPGARVPVGRAAGPPPERSPGLTDWAVLGPPRGVSSPWCEQLGHLAATGRTFCCGHGRCPRGVWAAPRGAGMRRGAVGTR